jgi:hypothetical protein
MGRRMRRYGWLIVVVFILLAALGGASPAPAAAAAPILVSNCLPSGSGSLAQALSDAASAPGDDTINFTTDCPDTSPLTVSGPLQVNSNVTINANGHTVTLTGGFNTNVFIIKAGTTVTMDGLNIKNSTPPTDLSPVSGGAIATEWSEPLVPDQWASQPFPVMAQAASNSTGGR